MREFFRGWKRKVGCVTLMMACLMMASWVRSRVKYDDIKLANGNVVCGVASMGGCLDLFRWNLEHDLGWTMKYSIGNSFDATDADGNPIEISPWSAGHEIEWRWDWAGFHIGACHVGNRRYEDCMIPYWSIVIPLTLISIWLLLSKPRHSTSKKTPELTANDGG